MELKFEGSEKLARKLKTVASKYPRERDMFLRMEAELVKARAKLLTPVDTGRLRNAWQRTEPSGGNVDIYNNTEYAAHVEYGHRVKIHGKYTGTVIPGVFMLKEAFEDSAEKFPADAELLLDRIFR